MKNIKKIQFILMFLFLLSSIIAKSQVGIGTTTPNASSELDVYATDKGFLLPRLTTAQRDAIVAPSAGLIIYNSTTLHFNYFDTVWNEMLSTLVTPDKGGTGIINNNAATLTLNGAFPIRLTTVADTKVTLPKTGVLYGTENGSISSSQILNSMSDETGTGNLIFSDTPNFSGVPTAPTAATGTNTTQLASTAFVMNNSNRYNSITASTSLSNSSPTYVAITGMAIAPVAGTYVVMFNSQYAINTENSNVDTATPVATTAQCLIDLQTVYNNLIATPTTNATHAPAFGSDETLTPGVYAIAAAASIAGTLTLDGLGDPNAVFIFKFDGAFSIGANSSIVLTNGASACNVFWTAEEAISIGAASFMKGVFIANNGAVFMAADGELEGQLFSITGAVSFGPGLMYLPQNCAYIDLGVLSTFIAFTGTGAIYNTGSSTITGDIGTNTGAITGFETTALDGTICNPSNCVHYTSGNVLATFSIYQNGVLIANSTRTKTNDSRSGEVSLQAVASVTAGQAIDVRWKITGGTLKVTNRILTLMNVR